MALLGKKTAIFIDGANLSSSASQIGMRIDFKKLLTFYEKNYDLIRAYYYTALSDNAAYKNIHSLVDWLSYNGYNVISKKAKEFVSEDSVKRIKGNMDCEIIVGMLEMAPHVDHLILFSGDGDFRCVVEAVQRMGKRVTIVSAARGDQSVTADELIRQADYFVDLADLRPHIGYDNNKS